MIYWTSIGLWILYGILEGFREACFYDVNSIVQTPNQSITWNLHPFFTMQRAIVLLLIYKVNGDFILLGGLPLIFSFVHDGMYYRIRNQLNNKVYSKGWWDNSTTSTAFIELNIYERSVVFVIGITSLILFR